MLAANFLTAEKLGLSELEHTALIGILGMLERGELQWQPADEARNHIRKNAFNMALEFIQGPCGAIGCIGGWCDAIYGTRFMNSARSGAINRLFFPPMNNRHWSRLTADDGARAIRSYLTTGEPEWPA